MQLRLRSANRQRKGGQDRPQYVLQIVYVKLRFAAIWVVEKTLISYQQTCLFVAGATRCSLRYLTSVTVVRPSIFAFGTSCFVPSGQTTRTCSIDV